MVTALKALVNSGCVRMKSGRWEVKQGGRWITATASQQSQLNIAYRTGDLDEAPNGVVRFR